MGKIRIPDLFYKKYGHGKETMLCFHGFGQEHSVFEKYTEAFPNHTIYSFDLFFHGKTKNDRKIEINTDTLKELMDDFFEKEKIQRCSLVSFSIGSLFCLQMLKLYKEQIDKCYLIAPFGLYKSPIYTLTTRSILIRTVFKRQILKPRFFFILLKLFAFLKLKDSRSLLFLKHQMNSRSKRYKVYYSWTKFEKLELKEKERKSLLESEGEKIEILLADKDDTIDSDKVLKSVAEFPKIKSSTISSYHFNAIDKALKTFKQKIIR